MGLIDVKRSETLDHPYEDETVTIRPLRGTEMDEASDVRVKKTVEMWGATLEVLQGLMKPQGEQEDTIAIRMKNYDASTLLKYAIVSWSYSETVDAAQIDNLDAITRAWLHEEVVRRNTRPLPPSKSGSVNSNSEGALQN